MFTFTQPAVDHHQQAAPAASLVSAVNYDRSPSLAGGLSLATSVATAEPDTPVEPREFESFAEAKAAFEAFLPGCNWPKPPTLKRFWYESEKHLSPGVDFVSWQFREHRLWTKADSGEIQPRPVFDPKAFKEAIEFSNELRAADAIAGQVTEVFAACLAVTRAEAEQQTADIAEALVDDIATDELAKPLTDVEAIQAGFSTPKEVIEPAAVIVVRRKFTDEEYSAMRKRAEEDFAIELQRAENRYAEISMERAKQEDVVKGLKAEEKAQLESLRSLKADGPTYPKNPEIKEDAKPAAAGSSQEGKSSAASEPSAAAAPTSELDVSDERYQRYGELALLPIVKDIKGLGSGKLSTLIDGFPTVGKLLDLQKEKGIFWFKEVGKGFGPELGNRIADAVADALKKVE